VIKIDVQFYRVSNALWSCPLTFLEVMPSVFCSVIAPRALCQFYYPHHTDISCNAVIVIKMLKLSFINR